MGDIQDDIKCNVDYQRGYVDGYKEGQTKANERLVANINLQAKPMVIVLNTQEANDALVETIKNGLFDALNEDHTGGLTGHPQLEFEQQESEIRCVIDQAYKTFKEQPNE